MIKSLLLKIHGNIFYLLPIAFILGLLAPGADYPGSIALKIIVSLIIFLSCFKVNLKHLSLENILLAFKFWLSRFILLPIILFLIANYFLPELAPAILILSLAPAGVSSIALASIFGGNITLCFILVIISSLSAPFIYTSCSALLLSSQIDLNIAGMLLELSIIIFSPIIFFLILSKIKPLNVFVNNYGSIWSTYLISLLLLFAIAMQREAFDFSSKLILDLAILTILYISYYLFGFIFSKVKNDQQLSLAICSGANNNALAITIAASFFASTELRFNVLSEILWFAGVIFFPKALNLLKRDKQSS